MNRGFRLAVTVFFAHYRQAPLQAGAIITGIILAVTLLTGVRAINENAIRSYSSAAEQLSLQADWFITPANGKKTLSESVYFDLRSQGYSKSLAVLEGELMSRDGERWKVQGSDIIAALSAFGSEHSGEQSHQDKQHGSLFDGMIPLPDMIAGKPVVLMSQNRADALPSDMPFVLGGEEVSVIGLADSYNLGNRILMDISLAQQLLNRPGQFSYIALFSEPDSRLLENQLTGRAQLSQSDKGESLEALTDSFHLNLTAMSMLAFVVGLFIAYNGIRYSLMKRQRLFTQLQQLGMTKKALLLALSTELLILVIAGSIVGFILGLQLSHWLHPMISMTLEQLFDANLLPGEWHWIWLIQAIGLTFAASIVACGSLFYQLWKQPLARVSRQLYQQKHSAKVYRVQLAISVTLLLLASALFPFTTDHRQTMALLGVVVLAIPLALPWSLSALVNIIAGYMPKGLLGYQLEETKELIAPMSLAMMAILLAVTANISMNTLVGSFESTLSRWLEVRLHADLYIRPAQSEITNIERFLNKQPDVTHVYKQYFHKSKHGVMPVYLVTKDNKTLRDTTIFKSSVKDVWPKFFSGETVIISEPMAIRLHLIQGQALQLEAIPDRTFTVGGVFYDYGNPSGEVLIAPDIWQQYGFTNTPMSLGVGFNGEPDNLRDRLVEQMGVPEALMYDQKQIKKRAITIFNRTFAITKVLNTLTLLVAAVGLFSACYMLTQVRAAPIARLYSLGVSRKQLIRMVISQMLSIVLLTCIVAMPAGALLGYLLINHVTLQAFGWTIAMQWNWPAYGQVVLLALAVSAVAIALPLYHQTRRPLVSSLQQEVI